eukprot:scaffold1704_cov246-Pinguiococcus_pyrenoidosus.AAC.7
MILLLPQDQVRKPTTKVETTVPPTANIKMVARFAKKRFLRKVYPASKMIGGNSAKKKTFEEKRNHPSVSHFRVRSLLRSRHSPPQPPHPPPKTTAESASILSLCASLCVNLCRSQGLVVLCVANARGWEESEREKGGQNGRTSGWKRRKSSSRSPGLQARIRPPTTHPTSIAPALSGM